MATGFVAMNQCNKPTEEWYFFYFEARKKLEGYKVQYN